VNRARAREAARRLASTARDIAGECDAGSKEATAIVELAQAIELLADVSEDQDGES
jgi:hypothetical protein